MKKLNESYLGKTVKCGEEWYMGYVFYTDIYKKNEKFFGKKKIYYNDRSKKIEKEYSDKEVMIIGWSELINNCGLLDYSI